MSIRIDADLTTTTIALRDIEDRLDKLAPALNAMGLYMLRSIDKNFRASGRPQKWRPLAPSTLAQRRKGRGAGEPKPLQDRGILRASVTPRRNSNSIFRVTNTEVQVGTNLEYARMQNDGTSRIPARPFMVYQKEDLDTFLPRIFWDFFTEVE